MLGYSFTVSVMWTFVQQAYKYAFVE